MLKQIIFKDTKDFNREIVLDFSKHINVILGPKGGGKSTLFDLVAGLKKNYICSKVIQALDEYNLKFDRAIYFNDETINATQLTKKKDKERDEDYKNRNDVIYQNDPIKNDLSSFKEINTDKFKYVTRQIEISEDVDKFILAIKNLYNMFNKINNFNNNNDINWTNTFKMSSSVEENKLELFTNLDYNPTDSLDLISQEQEEWLLLLRKIEEYNTRISKLQLTHFESIFDEVDFTKNITQKALAILDNNNKLISLIKERLNKLKKAKQLIDSFAYSYKKVIGEINNSNKLNTTLKTYEIKAKNHFKNLASEVINLRKNFEQLITNDYSIEIKNDENQKSNLTFFIPKKLTFSTDETIKILKTILPTPGSSVEDVTKWLKALVEKGIKEFDDDSLKREIAKIVNLSTKVLVDEGKDYESLSLGQRSIYGLKYKFNKSLSEDLFLDQPEDNLDNKTIAKEILDMLKQKNDQQVFIVTHNANIGMLSKPENVIVANLQNHEEPYKSIKLDKEQPVNYLEGGKEFLEQRYLEIFEEK